jgi:hypothetical protein
MKHWLSLRALYSPEALLILLAVASRLLPHPPNFTAVGAVAVFAGFFFTKQREALGVSLGALVLSDLYLGFHSILIWVYGAFAICVLLGRFLKPREGEPVSWGPILFGNLSAAVLFFVITNFGVWLQGSMYPSTWSGLSACFEAAIPFFRNSLSSQLLFGAALFSAHRLLRGSLTSSLWPSRPEA